MLEHFYDIIGAESGKRNNFIGSFVKQNHNIKLNEKS